MPREGCWERTRRGRAIAPGLAMLVVIGMAACRRAPGPDAPVSASRPIARINGQPVPEDRFLEFLKANTEGLEGEGGLADRKELFREFLLEQIILQQAHTEGMTVSDREVADAQMKWAEGTADAPPAFKAAVHDSLIVQGFLRRKVSSQVRVEPAAIQAYFKANPTEFLVREQVRLREILVEKRDQAEALRLQLKPRDSEGFQDLARLHSKSQLTTEPGEVVTFQRGELPEQFERVVFSLAPGAVSQVFESAHGYHLFFIEERLPSRSLSLQEVQNTIGEKLAAEEERAATEQYLRQLVQSVQIQILDDELSREWKRAYP